MADKKKQKKIKQITLQRWSQILEQLGNMEPPRLEEREACYHTHLQKVIKDDFTYQCQDPKCAAIIEIVGSAMYAPEQYAVKSAVINAHLYDTSEKAREIIHRYVEQMSEDEEANG